MSRVFRILLTVVSPLLIAGAVFAAIRLVSSRPLSAIIRGEVLSVDPATRSFAAREGEVVNAQFTVRNTSGHPIVLLGGTSACSCTVVTNNFPIELDAGGMTKVDVRMTVGPRDSDHRFRKSVTLFVNREGMVPSLILQATVLDSRADSTLPKK